MTQRAVVPRTALTIPISESTLEDLLRETYRPIEPLLHRLEETLQQVAVRGEGLVPQAARYVLRRRGKRLRPALVFMTAQLGHSQEEEVIKVGAAVELIHLATLIHDDIVDRAVLRHLQHTAAVEFGEDIALLLGDYLYTEAFSLLGDVPDTTLLPLFARTTRTMCEGEINQVRRRFQYDVSLEEYLSYIGRKTASFIGACGRAGARLAHAEEPIQHALETYGWNVGMAFQIVDDTLDLIGDERQVGKTLGTDFANGKLTLPLIYLRDTVEGLEREAFVALCRSPERRWSEVKGLLHERGALAKAFQRAGEFAKEAQAAVATLPDTPLKQGFHELATYVVRRTH
ncbi:MAG: polyprenyl synthetase family protein [Elusimicrobia bacterium]|nr:polyprenyl synthetase family protein [Elusimicrobiota bacterium]